MVHKVLLEPGNTMTHHEFVNTNVIQTIVGIVELGRVIDLLRLLHVDEVFLHMLLQLLQLHILKLGIEVHGHQLLTGHTEVEVVDLVVIVDIHGIVGQVVVATTHLQVV